MLLWRLLSKWDSCLNRSHDVESNRGPSIVWMGLIQSYIRQKLWIPREEGLKTVAQKPCPSFQPAAVWDSSSNTAASSLPWIPSLWPALQIKLQTCHILQALDAGRLKVKWEGGGRGWDGWKALSTQWTWVWTNSKIMRDRETWSVALHGVTKSQTWVRDWTTRPPLHQDHRSHAWICSNGFPLLASWPEKSANSHQGKGSGWK